jgi:hypothetical protein
MSQLGLNDFVTVLPQFGKLLVFLNLYQIQCLNVVLVKLIIFDHRFIDFLLTPSFLSECLVVQPLFILLLCFTILQHLSHAQIVLDHLMRNVLQLLGSSRDQVIFLFDSWSLSINLQLASELQSLLSFLGQLFNIFRVDSTFTDSRTI